MSEREILGSHRARFNVLKTLVFVEALVMYGDIGFIAVNKEKSKGENSRYTGRCVDFNANKPIF